mmetsp:Transcript_20443/g.37267  ORF Transcript_20443/g.37267 Transcript_20443/m.37267 type:complete len:228 (-) Transcript_20443:1041-1724(-)
MTAKDPWHSPPQCVSLIAATFLATVKQTLQQLHLPVGIIQAGVIADDFLHNGIASRGPTENLRTPHCTEASHTYDSRQLSAECTHLQHQARTQWWQWREMLSWHIRRGKVYLQTDAPLCGHVAGDFIQDVVGMDASQLLYRMPSRLIDIRNEQCISRAQGKPHTQVWEQDLLLLSEADVNLLLAASTVAKLWHHRRLNNSPAFKSFNSELTKCRHLLLQKGQAIKRN